MCIHVCYLLLNMDTLYHIQYCTEAEFFDVIGTKVSKVLRIFLLAIHSNLYYGFYPPPPQAKVV